jgi:hypothetical protein
MINYSIPDGNWKTVKGYDKYLISDDGRVYSTYSKRLLKCSLNEHGYHHVELWRKGKGKKFFVHRLVIENFGDEEPKRTVNHIDGNKINNHISNLEWATHEENNIHAIKTGLRPSLKNNKKLSTPVEQRDLNGNLIKVFPSIKQASIETGVDQTDISRGIRKGWKYGGYQWSRANKI